MVPEEMRRWSEGVGPLPGPAPVKYPRLLEAGVGYVAEPPADVLRKHQESQRRQANLLDARKRANAAE